MFQRSFPIPQWKTGAGQRQSYDMEGGKTVSRWINVGAACSFRRCQQRDPPPPTKEPAGAWDVRCGPSNWDQKAVIMSRVLALWRWEAGLCFSWGLVSLNAGLFPPPDLVTLCISGPSFSRRGGEFPFLSPKGKDTWAFPGYVILQNTTFLLSSACTLNLKFFKPLELPGFKYLGI